MITLMIYIFGVLKPYMWLLYMCIMRFMKDYSQPQSYGMEFFLKNYIWYVNKLDYYFLIEMNIELLILTFIVSTIIVLLLGNFTIKSLI